MAAFCNAHLCTNNSAIAATILSTSQGPNLYSSFMSHKQTISSTLIRALRPTIYSANLSTRWRAFWST
jgi:hypothetical protein